MKNKSWIRTLVSHFVFTSYVMYSGIDSFFNLLIMPILYLFHALLYPFHKETRNVFWNFLEKLSFDIPDTYDDVSIINHAGKWRSLSVAMIFTCLGLSIVDFVIKVHFNAFCNMSYNALGVILLGLVSCLLSEHYCEKKEVVKDVKKMLKTKSYNIHLFVCCFLFLIISPFSFLIYVLVRCFIK